MEERKRVLIVENNEGVRQFYVVVLADYYEVVAVADHEGALAALVNQGPFDVALIDVGLLGSDDTSGTVVAGAAKCLKPTPRVVMMSMRSREELGQEVLADADMFLLKTSEEAELLRAVEGE